MRKLITTALSITCLSGIANYSHAEEPDLISHMGSFQYFTHKTTLAIDKRNKPLASFYVHEIEHTLKNVKAIETFDDYPVGELAETLLEPAFEDLEDALESEPWTVISDKLDAVFAACNQCHKTTNHGFIHVKRPLSNPYMQSFEPAAD